MTGCGIWPAFLFSEQANEEGIRAIIAGIDFLNPDSFNAVEKIRFMPPHVIPILEKLLNDPSSDIVTRWVAIYSLNKLTQYASAFNIEQIAKKLEDNNLTIRVLTAATLLGLLHSSFTQNNIVGEFDVVIHKAIGVLRDANQSTELIAFSHPPEPIREFAGRVIAGHLQALSSSQGITLSAPSWSAYPNYPTSSGVRAQRSWVTQTDNVVRFFVPIEFRGAATESLVSRWIQEINGFWNGPTGSRSFMGCELIFVAIPRIREPGASASDGWHQIFIKRDLFFEWSRSNVMITAIPDPDPRRKQIPLSFSSSAVEDPKQLWSSQASQRTLAHEFGHLLALGDEYTDADGNLNPQPTDPQSIMATVNGPVDVLPEHLELIVQRAREQGLNINCPPTNQSPTATITTPADASTFEVGEAITFTAEANDPDGQIVSYIWNFGDGVIEEFQTNAGSSVTHSYSQVGNYTVTLTVGDNDGATTSNSILVVIESPIMTFTDPWPMFQHDAQHTGRSELSGPVIGEVEWTTDIGVAISEFPRSSQPVIDRNGVIYLGVGYDDGSPAGKLYALNPDGGLKWTSFDLEGIPTTPAIDSDGTIYVGTINQMLGLNGAVYAVNPDGTEKWRFRCQDPGGILAITISPDTDGTLYFTCNSLSPSRLYALTPSGIQKWSYQYPQQYFREPAIGLDGTIYAVYPGFVSLIQQSSGVLHALRPDGTLKWMVSLDFEMGIPHVGSDGAVYIAGRDRFYAINPDGSTKWQVAFPDRYLASGALAPWVVDGPGETIIVGGMRSTDRASILRAFSTSNGDPLWTSIQPGILTSWGLVTDADGTLFGTWLITLTSINRLSKIYSIDGTTGALNWTLELPVAILSYPTLGTNGRLYIALNPVAGNLEQARVYSLR